MNFGQGFMIEGFRVLGSHFAHLHCGQHGDRFAAGALCRKKASQSLDRGLLFA